MIFIYIYISHIYIYIYIFDACLVRSLSSVPREVAAHRSAQRHTSVFLVEVLY